MTLQEMVVKTFIKTLEKAEIPTELKRACVNQERKNTFLENLYKQLLAVDEVRAKANKPKLKKSTIEWAVENMTLTFIDTVAAFADARKISAAEKTRLKTIADNIEDIESTLKGKPKGDYADIVASVEDTRGNKRYS